MPAASWPRCWSACRPSATIAGGVGTPDAEHAAFLAQFVVVEGMGGQHGAQSPSLKLDCLDGGHIGREARLVAGMSQIDVDCLERAVA
jgi:hypothetical protein